MNYMKDIILNLFIIITFRHKNHLSMIYIFYISVQDANHQCCSSSLFAATHQGCSAYSYISANVAVDQPLDLSIRWKD